jgi:hypothetical protein
MLKFTSAGNDSSFLCGTLVVPAGDLAGVQAPDGSFVVSENLGPGKVEQVGQHEMLLIHWERAGFATWVTAQDLRSLGADAHLVAVEQRNSRGDSGLLHYLVDTKAGLRHNWTVEMLPRGVVRAIREDRAAWTFSINPVSDRVEACWPQPPDDDCAEALAAAELVSASSRHKRPRFKLPWKVSLGSRSSESVL